MMRTSDLLRLSTRMFKTRRMRTSLTVLGIGVGIGTVLFLVSLGYGLQEAILSRISSAEALLTLEVGPGPAEELRLTADGVEKIAALPHVKEVSRRRAVSAQVSRGSITSNGTVNAVDASFLRLHGVRLVAGSLPDAESVRQVVVTVAGAKLLNAEPESLVGSTIRLTLTPPTDEGTGEVETVPQGDAYTVVGVLEDERSNDVYVRIRDVSGVPITYYDQLKVLVDDSSALEPTRQVIVERGYLVSALSDTIDQVNKVFRVIQIVLGLFGLVALIVSAIGMFNTMTITLLERTNEIGIMRSIGITKSDVRLLFLVESMLMSFLGGVAGLVLGTIAGFLANVVVNQLASRFGGATVDIFHTPAWFALTILTFSAVIGFLTGVYPSFRASRINPLDALRYK